MADVADVADVAEVVVVGLGAMGSCALWRLARRGLDVVGIEQFEPGHARGASHGQSRIIRTAYAEGAGYVPLTREAWRLWDELSAARGVDLVRRTGGLMLAPAGSGGIEAPQASAEAHGLPYELLTAEEIRRRFPQHRVDDDTAGFYEEDAGFVRAEEAVLAAVGQARAYGARVLTGVTVAGVFPDTDRPRVKLADGSTIVARHLVVAAGAWHRKLLVPMAPKIAVVRRVFGWFTFRGDFGPSRFPIFIRSDVSGERAWYGIPSLDGRTVKLGIHVWPGIDEPVDPAVGAREPDPVDARRLSRIAGDYLSGLDSEPARMQVCMYSSTADGDFLVGPVQGVPGVTVLGGFSGHGFKFAPVLGDIAADLATTGETRWDIGFLDADRKM
ncbi:MAG TPA: N-methyl-L-tryptophan oxidase [Candidatus Limnocylindrales bacterium]|nr:N-methyl-L-tryptophan oxidase [Candidatus Limnocylindrales bacterium]